MIRAWSTLPIILKGVQTGADAVLALRAGLDGIVVSNHGGRNMDTARPSLEALVEGEPRNVNHWVWESC